MGIERVSALLWRHDGRGARPCGRHSSQSYTFVLAPYAGGSAYGMADWPPALVGEDDTALLLQYPGRGPRWNDPPPASVHELADAAAQELTDLGAGGSGPLVLIGHSMGSVVSYEVAARLAASGRDAALLVASGAPPPQMWNLDAEVVTAMTTEEWRDWIGSVGFAEDAEEMTPDVLEMAIPVLRGDCLILARHPAPERPLGCPVVAIGGAEDPQVADGRIGEWKTLTTGPVATHLLPGGHFYYRDRLPEVCALIRAALDQFG